jgi:two-component sensor histidine kinase
MSQILAATQRWSLWVRLGISGGVLAAAYLFQIPLEREVPGDPFLIFLLSVICTAVAFGARVGFVSVGVSTVLSTLFFDPIGSLALYHASDLVRIELYAILAAGCVILSASLAKALIAADEKSDVLSRADENKSILLRELTHGVANNFAAVAALINTKALTVIDSKARSILDEAIEQIEVMACVHRLLRTRNEGVSLDSNAFFHELCEKLEASVGRGRPISIECNVDSHPLCMSQAVSLGLIVNELVTNSIKHAFPDGSAGRIRIGLIVRGDQLHLTVQDNGTGFDGRFKRGDGQNLVKGLSQQLGGNLRVETSGGGSAFLLTIPCERSALPTNR